MQRQEQLWEAYIESFRTACSKNDHELAERILNSAFADAEEYLELDCRLIWATHSLASSYCSDGSESRAANLYQRLVELTEKVLGVRHPDVVESLEKVAASQLKNGAGKRIGFPLAV